jgi:anti-sigma factor RsiW
MPLTKQSNARRWDEGLLVAYVDGELDPERARTVAATIRDDAEAQAIVAALRRSAAAVKGAFDEPLHQPVPARLLGTLERGAACLREAEAASLRRRQAGDRDRVVPLRGRRFDLRRSLLPLAAALAALVVGFGGGYVFQAPERDQSLRLAGTATADPAAERFEETLYRALAADAMGDPFAYDDPESGARGTVALLGRVDTSLGVPCREFRHEATRGAATTAAQGLACRAGDGSWSVLVLPADGGS